jgi:hypothetical protein
MRLHGAMPLPLKVKRFKPVKLLHVHQRSLSVWHSSILSTGVVRKTGVYIEKWEGIDSYSIDNLRKNARFPYLPTWRGYGSQFTQPQNWGENFGTRIRAYFVPKESGAHVFFICKSISFFIQDLQLWIWKQLCLHCLCSGKLSTLCIKDTAKTSSTTPLFIIVH